MNPVKKTMIGTLVAASIYSFAAVAQNASDANASPAMDDSATYSSQPSPKTENGITYMTGGVGADEVRTMKDAAKNYDVMVTFASGKTGAYLADVKVDIDNAKGENVLSTVSEGPIFLADLPKGKYRIRAETEGKTITRQVQVSGHGRAKTSMVWPENLVVTRTPEPSPQPALTTSPSMSDDMNAAPAPTDTNAAPVQ